MFRDVLANVGTHDEHARLTRTNDQSGDVFSLFELVQVLFEFLEHRRDRTLALPRGSSRVSTAMSLSSVLSFM